MLLKEWWKGMIEVTEKQGRKHTQLLDNLTEGRGYWKLRGKKEVLDRSLWRTRFGYGPVVIRQTTELMNL
jgi:hypothetical protein